MRARFVIPLAFAAIAASSAPMSRAEDVADVEAFPVPERIADAVTFWDRVWSEWSTSQVVLHDAVHLGVVYDVVDLPGAAGDAYTKLQKDFVSQLKDAFAKRIETIERRVAAREVLDDSEKAIALRIVSAGGSDAVSGAASRVRVQRGLRERFLAGVAISARYLPEFRTIFREAGLPEDIAYLPHVESSFRSDARSSAGAVGMWQFTRHAGKLFLTIDAAIDERLDPIAAARGAARYLRKAHDELGSWPLALTSYNHGLGGMRRAKERFGDDLGEVVARFEGRSFGFASRNFYASFIAARDAARRIEDAPPPDFVPASPFEHDRFVLQRPTRAVSLARAFGVELGSLSAINPAWTRRAVVGNASLPAGTTVWLPAGTLDRMASGSRAGGRDGSR